MTSHSGTMMEPRGELEMFTLCRLKSLKAYFRAQLVDRYNKFVPGPN